jgi:rod shape determining protein RodA
LRKESGIFGNLDWVTVLVYSILVIWGWFNIYASVYDSETAASIFDLSINSGKQLLWIGTAVVLIIIILIVDFRVYESFAPILYLLFVLLLAAVLVFGVKINGARAWFQMGSFRLQPAEFAKFATALMLAKFVSGNNIKLSTFKDQLRSVLILGLPIGLILLQPDAGSAMVFLALLIPLYREGFPPLYIAIGLSLATILILTYLIPPLMLILSIAGLAGIFIYFVRKARKKILSVVFVGVVCIGIVFGADYVFNDVLKDYQRSRIDVILKPSTVNKQAEGWNLEQSKIAIGSGRFAGKGFLKGTQTKFGYVPEQSTDFIFSTLAEERGWLGSLALVALFMVLLFRIVHLAERQKHKFARMYGYSVAAIIFFHFTVNIAMTIGLFPVIGIPLPFFSYGGSSLWSFTIMLFVLLKIDMHRSQVLMRS